MTAQPLGCGSGCTGGCSKEQHCAYEQSYAEGSSVTGFWFQDSVQLADALVPNAPVNATLGCHTDERKLFYTQRVNGIMGLAPRRTEQNMPTILRELFSDKTHVSTQLFSICLAEWGGILTVGGQNPSYHKTDSAVQWLKMSTFGYYAVTPLGLTLGGIPLVDDPDAFGSQTIVDSGTTFSYFSLSVFDKLVAAIRAFCDAEPGCGATLSGGDGCYQLDDINAGPVKFPTLTLVFQGDGGVNDSIVVSWKPEAYMYPRDEPGLFCRAFDQHAAPHTVLGLSWLLHKDVILDLANRRLGIAEASCPTHRLAPGEHPMANNFAFKGNINVFGNRWSVNTTVGVLALVGAILSFAALCFLLVSAVLYRSAGRHDPREERSSFCHVLE
jgi:hypothetical protein